MIRTDGRAANQLRPVTITPNYTIHPEGSVLVGTGGTRVVDPGSGHEPLMGDAGADGLETLARAGGGVVRAEAYGGGQVRRQLVHLIHAMQDHGPALGVDQPATHLVKRRWWAGDCRPRDDHEGEEHNKRHGRVHDGGFLAGRYTNGVAPRGRRRRVLV